MGFGIISKVGIILAVAVSIVGGIVARSWDPNESAAYNIFLLIFPLIFPKPQPIMDKSVQVQADYWDKESAKMVKQATGKAAVTSNGPAYYEASFGKTPTRMANFTIPSVQDPTHQIPVVCACPYNATPGTKLPLILYTFAGGLILGSIEAELPLSRWLAQEANAVVCSIGYRKPPLYPYPTPVNDVMDASVGILEKQASVELLLGAGIDSERIATWGTSGGGYMSAQLARRLTANGRSLKCQFSFAPMAKPHGGTQSMLHNWNDVWSGPHNVYAWAVFLPGDDGTLAEDWGVSLLMDPPEEVVERLPPAYIEIHKRDPLHDEGELYAKRLKEQGKLIELRVYDVSHIGNTPSLSRGGSADGSYDYAVSVMKRYL